jgi:NADH dehydrogenase
MAGRVALVYGGSGFVGRHVVRRLAAKGMRVRVAVRDPVGAEFLRPMGDIGQVVPVYADVGNEASVRAVAQGADLVVNLTGILYQRGRQRFDAIHVAGAGAIARAAKDAGTHALVHLSALGANPYSKSAYACSKAKGEDAVLAAFPDATILRPSVIFGPEDSFFNRFASLSTFSPILPVFVNKTGGPRFQPVYVGDVADVVLAALSDRRYSGKTYSLGGPRVYTMEEIMRLVLTYSGRKRLLMRLPLSVAALKSVVLQLLPTPLLTPDQVRLMATDNVLPDGVPGFDAFGISPVAVEAILPTYFALFRNPFLQTVA